MFVRSMVGLAFLLSGCAFKFSSQDPTEAQTITVGQTITFGVSYENQSTLTELVTWGSESSEGIVELIGDRETTIAPHLTGGDSRAFRAVAAGRTSLFVRNNPGNERALDVTVQAVATGTPTLTVTLRSAGTVTSTPAGVSCTNALYNRTPPKVCAVSLPPGRYALTFKPDETQGFFHAAVTGCSVTDFQCSIDLTADQSIDVLFDH